MKWLAQSYTGYLQQKPSRTARWTEEISHWRCRGKSRPQLPVISMLSSELGGRGKGEQHPSRAVPVAAAPAGLRNEGSCHGVRQCDEQIQADYLSASLAEQINSDAACTEKKHTSRSSSWPSGEGGCMEKKKGRKEKVAFGKTKKKEDFIHILSWCKRYHISILMSLASC